MADELFKYNLPDYGEADDKVQQTGGHVHACVQRVGR